MHVNNFKVIINWNLFQNVKLDCKRITVDHFFLSLWVLVDRQFLSISLALLLKIEILILITVCRAQQLALKVLDKRQQTSVSNTYIFSSGDEQRGWGGGGRKKKRGERGRVMAPCRPAFSEKHDELSISARCYQYSWEEVKLKSLSRTQTHTQISTLTRCIQQFNRQSVWMSLSVQSRYTEINIHGKSTLSRLWTVILFVNTDDYD